MEKRMCCLLGGLLLIGLAACSAPLPEKGVLEGHVTIGPLSPVVQEGVPESTPSPEVYAARQIVVLAEDSQSEVARVQIGGDGNYRVELRPGSYVVDINYAGIDRGIDLPQTVAIASGATTRLDVAIDTGIR